MKEKRRVKFGMERLLSVHTASNGILNFKTLDFQSF